MWPAATDRVGASKAPVPWRLSPLKRADTVIVPGIDNLDRLIPPELLRALRAAVSRRARVASVCTGAFILARTGALDGLRATTHWLAAQEFARRHSAIKVVRRAQQLLETSSLSIEQVATAAGFRSASMLREHFGGTVGTTPLAYRRAFGNAKSAEHRKSR